MEQDSSPRDNKDRCFKGQQKTEEVICFCRKHWIVLIRYLLEFIILNIILVTVLFSLWGNPLALSHPAYRILIFTGLTISAYFFHRFFVEILDYYLTIVIITNYRIIDLRKTVILHDDKNVIDLHEIQDIQKIQNGLVRNILNYGTIKIALAGVPETRILRYIPNPDRYFRRINKAKRDYILKKRFAPRQHFLPRRLTEATNVLQTQAEFSRKIEGATA